MIALHVEGRDVLAGRERGRIEHAEPEPLRARPGSLEETPRVLRDEGMIAREAVQAEVVLRPAQNCRRSVDGDGPAGAAARRGASEGTRVAEEVQERGAGALGADARAGLAVIGKEAGVEKVVEVHEEPQRRLAHLETGSGSRKPRVAIAGLRPGATRP